MTSGGVLGSGGAVAIVLALAIFVGQGSTEFDIVRFLTLVALVVLGIVVLIGVLFTLVARKHLAGDSTPDPPKYLGS